MAKGQEIEQYKARLRAQEAQRNPVRMVSTEEMDVAEIKDALSGLKGADREEYLKNVDLRDFAASELVDAELSSPDIVTNKEQADKYASALEKAELRKQKSIAQQVHPEVDIERLIAKGSPSKTSEQQFARDLIMEGKVPKNVPPDRFLGKDYKDKTQLGIDGPFAPDSEVRGHTKLVEGKDGTFSVKRVGVQTEIPSPKGVDNLYQSYLKNLTYKDQANRFSFNAHLSEYYGQQGLKLRGAKPVSNANRSEGQKRARRYGEPSTLDTDRLIETTRAFSDPEVRGEPADFRYQGSKGNTIVSDMELKSPGTESANIIKNAKSLDNVSDSEVQRILAKYIDVNDQEILDSAINRAQQAGELPRWVKSTKSEGGDPKGMRPGKAVSNAPIAGKTNTQQQYRYDQVVTGKLDQSKRAGLYGFLPESLQARSTRGLRDSAAKAILKAQEGRYNSY